VKALVVKIDPDLKRVALSLKASHFDGDADMSESDEESAESEEEDESTSSSNNDEVDDYESDDENYIDRLRAHVKIGQGSDTDDSDNEDYKQKRIKEYNQDSTVLDMMRDKDFDKDSKINELNQMLVLQKKANKKLSELLDGATKQLMNTTAESTLKNKELTQVAQNFDTLVAIYANDHPEWLLSLKGEDRLLQKIMASVANLKDFWARSDSHNGTLWADIPTNPQGARSNKNLTVVNAHN
jgi:hypothetical protein